MEPAEIIKYIKNEVIDSQKNNGETAISINALDDYLDRLALDADDSNHMRNRDHEKRLAQFQADNQQWIKQYEIANTHKIEEFRSVISSGHSALKSCMVINGAAALALLAFIGNTLKSPIDNIQELLAMPIWLFCLGVLCSAIAAGGTYLTQFSYHHEWIKTAVAFQLSTIMLVLASYFLFGYACYETAMFYIPNLK